MKKIFYLLCLSLVFLCVKQSYAASTCTPIGLVCNRSYENFAGECCLGLTCITSNGLPGQGYCVMGCPECINCNNDPSWSAHATGYQKMTMRVCDCGNCVVSVQYQCAPGYYGASTNGSSGCTRCPEFLGFSANSAAGTTSITGCYILPDTSINDSVGSFKYSSECYYGG